MSSKITVPPLLRPTGAASQDPSLLTDASVPADTSDANGELFPTRPRPRLSPLTLSAASGLSVGGFVGTVVPGDSGQVVQGVQGRDPHVAARQDVLAEVEGSLLFWSIEKSV